jgi:hypothetical protein
MLAHVYTQGLLLPPAYRLVSVSIPCQVHTVHSNSHETIIVDCQQIVGVVITIFNSNCNSSIIQITGNYIKFFIIFQLIGFFVIVFCI